MPDVYKRQDNYYEYSNKIAGYDLLFIDDFGLMDLNLDKCRDLFEIIEASDCRKYALSVSMNIWRNVKQNIVKVNTRNHDEREQ